MINKSIGMIGEILNLNMVTSISINTFLIYSIPIILLSVIQKKKRPIVEQVFLIHEDGRLISYASLKGDEYPDEDLVSGMLTAVMNVLMDAFGRKDGIKQDISHYKFEFGERTAILEMGKHFFIALVILGKEDKALRGKSKAAIKNIEGRYGDIFAIWDGNMKDFEGADEIIMTLLPLEELSEEERETVGEEETRKKVFELWAMKYVHLLQDSLMPKAHIMKSLKWKLDKEDEEEPVKEEEEEGL